ncbi:hypothetical protein LNKW23_35450 [Paralimibaculum aggregatum]|uniref:Uncharacterized protein n=1 Tax=Paralimibaculum aggregatum TaxID=3036245 RepID=A0ABQ6LMA2_9RHOB|nr:hypothetical protein [Limibaculum sp. NKW23]GMG84330.1 hypothetical protein LNKW23_35450 [Limibaculum sp. NKW23]
MATTPANDPTAPVLKAVEIYQKRIFEIWKVVFKKIDSKFKSATKFFDNVVNKGEEIASKVGKAVVEKIIGYRDTVFGALERVPQIVKSALRLGNKIINLIRSAADPNKIINVMKRLFMRYVKMLREIFAMVKQFFEALNPLGTALAVVNALKSVLRLIVSWVGEVTNANNAVKKAKTLLKKVVKAMKLEIKEAILLRKKVLRLRPA